MVASRPHIAQHGRIVLDTRDADHEAGDLLQAEIDIAKWPTLADVVNQTTAYQALASRGGPVFFKSCGWAGWVGAGRVDGPGAGVGAGRVDGPPGAGALGEPGVGRGAGVWPGAGRVDGPGAGADFQPFDQTGSRRRALSGARQFFARQRSVEGTRNS